MPFPNPLNYVRKLYPKVRKALSEETVAYWAEYAEERFPKAANGIKRGKEKLAFVRKQLEKAYNAIEGWGPAFDVVWPIAAAAIERYLAKRAK